MQEVQVAPRSNPLRSLLKWILHQIVKVVILAGRFFRRYPLPALILLIIFLGGAMMLGSGLASVPGVTPAVVPPTDARVAVETYLTGQRDFNADLMWQAMDDELKQAWQERGRSLSDLRQMQQSARQNGIKYNAAQHAFSGELDEGRKVLLYIVTISQGEARQQVPYTFVVNRANKIISVD